MQEFMKNYNDKGISYMRSDWIIRTDYNNVLSEDYIIISKRMLSTAGNIFIEMSNSLIIFTVHCGSVAKCTLLNSR